MGEKEEKGGGGGWNKDTDCHGVINMTEVTKRGMKLIHGEVQ